MALLPSRLLSLIFLISYISVTGQNRTPQIQKEPEWVTQNSVSTVQDNLDKDGEDGIVDLVYERQISLGTESVFSRRMIKLISESGVQNNSEVSVDFDPNYQQLLFHKINLIRNGHVINNLSLAKMKTIHREKDLKNFIYNGTLSAVIFLEDVQKGDIIEYSYTIKGFNPIFGGKYSTELNAMFSVPIYQIYFKVLVPKARSISIENRNTGIKPVISQTVDNQVYEWRLKDVPALHTEDHVPAWYNPFPTIMLSEFKNWKEVNDWAMNLFKFGSNSNAALTDKIQEFRRIKGPEKQLLTALRFVQDDIRYLGIEMGENSQKPHSPDQILQQRFGDCKDKSYLLCSILHGLNIEAHPVLINTESKRVIFSFLPAPTVFDHTTVQVRLNGKIYWFDPTISFQKGPIESITFPDYSAGLVINDTTTQLSNISLHDKSLVTIKEIFNIQDMDGRGQLSVVTEYRGSSADNVRTDFKSASNFELRKSYKDFYEGFYKNIKSDSLISFDNELTGVFTIKEYYTFDSLWGEYASMKKALFQPYVIYGLLKKPEGSSRSMPLEQRFPAHYIEEVQVNLPEIWPPQHTEHNTETSAFRLSTNCSGSGKHLVLRYEFESLKDHITPGEYKEYIDKIDKAEETIGYSLTKTLTEDSDPVISSSGGNYPTLYFMLGICVFITYMVRKKR